MQQKRQRHNLLELLLSWIQKEPYRNPRPHQSKKNDPAKRSFNGTKSCYPCFVYTDTAKATTRIKCASYPRRQAAASGMMDMFDGSWIMKDWHKLSHRMVLGLRYGSRVDGRHRLEHLLLLALLSIALPRHRLVSLARERFELRLGEGEGGGEGEGEG